jgi:hypothetical protein
VKNVLVQGKKVEDVAGLFYDLIKNGYMVENIGSDRNGTHVFLADEETKDPGPVVDSWVGKEPPTPTKSLVEQRKELHAEYQAKRAQRQAEARAKAAAEMGEGPVAIATPLPFSPAKSPTLFSKIFRKLW